MKKKNKIFVLSFDIFSSSYGRSRCYYRCFITIISFFPHLLFFFSSLTSFHSVSFFISIVPYTFVVPRTRLCFKWVYTANPVNRHRFEETICGRSSHNRQISLNSSSNSKIRCPLHHHIHRLTDQRILVNSLLLIIIIIWIEATKAIVQLKLAVIIQIVI